MKSVLVPAAFVILAACSSSAESSSPETTTAAKQATTTTLSPAALALNQRARTDVAVTSCAPNGTNDLVIKGTAHNTMDGRAGYTVQLAVGDRSGKRLYATAASVDAVPPGGTGHWSAVTSAPYRAGMTCKITNVSVRPES